MSGPPEVPPLPGDHLVDLLGRALAFTGQRPWLAALPVAAAAAATAVRGMWRRARHDRMARHAHQVAITPPAQVDPAGAAAFWANLRELLAPSPLRRVLRGRPHVAVEYRWTGRRFTIGVWVPGAVPAGPVAAAARAAWPGAATTIAEPVPPAPLHAAAVGGALTPALPPWYPLRADHETDPMRALVAAASGLHAAEHACVQVLARPAAPRQAARLRRAAAGLRAGAPAGGALDPAGWLRGLLNLITELLTPAGTGQRRGGARARPAAADPVRDRDARAAADKAAWEVAIRYAVANANPRDAPAESLRARQVTLAHAITSAFGAHTGRNRLRRRRLHHPAKVLAARRLGRGCLLSAAELAAIAALPLDTAVPGLDRARAKSIPAPITVPAGGRGTKPLGRAEAGGHAVALPVADARHHIHLLGSTGSGKSTAMTHMILADIRAGRGVVVIDPKGDLALDVLDRIPAALADRIVIIDPDQPGGATLNPLVGVDDDLVVDNIVSIFSKIFARHWGPRIDDVLRVACLTVMRHPDPTLVLVPPLLNNKQFRAPFTADLDDPEGLKGFWEWYETTPPPLRAQVIGPILARLRSFLLRDFVRATLGPPASSFDTGKVLDGGVLIARLPKGQLGEETAKLMGSFVLASVWQAATARARLPEPARRDAAVYIDEAHNVLNLAGSVGDMLAEARGYHLALVLAHQNLAQLPRDTQLALSANARNKIYFTCAPEDAHQLARHTEPELDTHDLSHLDAYTAAARLVVAGRETAAFTLRTSPPAEPVGQTAAIRRAVARPTPATATAPPAPDAGHAQAQAPARAPGQAGPRRPPGRPDDAGKAPEATENRR